jgi:hypothetical protein
MRTVFEDAEIRVPNRADSNGRTRRKPHAPPQRRRSLVARLTEQAAYFTAFRDFALSYFENRAEAARVEARKAVQFAVSRAVCGAMLLTVAVAAIVLLLQGISGGLAAALGGRAWAGDLITAGMLGLFGLGMWLYMKLSVEPERPTTRRRPARRR